MATCDTLSISTFGETSGAAGESGSGKMMSSKVALEAKGSRIDAHMGIAIPDGEDSSYTDVEEKRKR